MAGMSDLKKMSFLLDAADWHGSSLELLWVKSIPAESMLLFEIQNTPFFSKDVSFLDIVRGNEASEGLMFDGLIVSSGHSTYRLLTEDVAAFELHWAQLQEIGCTYESSKIDSRWLYAVDVPPTTDIYAAYAIFQRGQEAGAWYFEEGRVGHQLRS